MTMGAYLYWNRRGRQARWYAWYRFFSIRSGGADVEAPVVTASLFTMTLTGVGR
jgi:hypothetical protein